MAAGLVLVGIDGNARRRTSTRSTGDHAVRKVLANMLGIDIDEMVMWSYYCSIGEILSASARDLMISDMAKPEIPLPPMLGPSISLLVDADAPETLTEPDGTAFTALIRSSEKKMAVDDDLRLTPRP